MQPLSLAQLWSIPFPNSSVLGMSPRRYVPGGTADSSHSDGRCVPASIASKSSRSSLLCGTVLGPRSLHARDASSEMT